MNPLFISILVLGLSSLNPNLSMLFDGLSNASFKVDFDINKFEDDKLREYPGIIYVPSYGKVFGDFNTEGSWIKYWPSVNKRGKISGRTLIISCPMYNTPYEALRWVGFTHEQILGAKRISTKTYEVKTPARTCRVLLSTLEQRLGNGRGYDSVRIRWASPE